MISNNRSSRHHHHQQQTHGPASAMVTASESQEQPQPQNHLNGSGSGSVSGRNHYHQQSVFSRQSILVSLRAAVLLLPLYGLHYLVIVYRPKIEYVSPFVILSFYSCAILISLFVILLFIFFSFL